MSVKNLFINSLLATVAATVLLTTQAHAEAGKRLCATWAGPTALVFKIKQPNGPGGRRAANGFCNEVNASFKAGYIDAGIPADIIKEASRIECEGLAGEMSGGRNRSDICHHIALSAVGDGAHPYKVDYDRSKNSFSFERL